MSELRFKFSIIKELPFIITHLGKARRMIRETDKYTSADRFFFGVSIMDRMRKSAKTHTKVYGMENIPSEGGFVMYSNHQGRYDGMGILKSFGRPCRILWKKSAADYIVARECAGLMEAKLIDVENELLDTLRKINQIAKEVKDEGRIYLIFPEGYYKDNKNTLQEFKTGCFRCSSKSHTTILPICLYDSWKSMNQGLFKGWVTTQVHYLKPIPYEEYKDLSDEQIAELVKSRIQQRIDEIENGTFNEEPSMYF